MRIKRLGLMLVLIVLLLVLVNSSCDLRDGKATFVSAATIETPEVVRGEEFIVTVEITNTGDQEGTQNIELLFGGEGVVATEENVTLGPGDDIEIKLTYSVPEDYELGYVDVIVKSDDSSATETIEVIAEPAFFEIEIKEIETQIPAGQTLEILARVNNTGGELGKQLLT